MGDEWDDDEWDVDDDALEKQLAEKLKEQERAKRREAGEESEDEDDEPAPVAATAAPTPGQSKPKAKPKKKKGAQETTEEPVEVIDTQAEKLRRRQLELEADDRLADDLFSGCSKADAEIAKEEEEKKKKDAEEAEAERKRKEAAAKPKVVIVDQFDSLTLDVQSDVEKLCLDCLDKINKGKAKDSGGRFLVELLKGLEADLSFLQLTELEKMLATNVKEKKANKGAVDAKVNKANTKLSKTTKFNTGAEWEEVYGGGEGDEDWTAEEWAEWEKKENEKWTASQAAK